MTPTVVRLDQARVVRLGWSVVKPRYRTVPQCLPQPCIKSLSKLFEAFDPDSCPPAPLSSTTMCPPSSFLHLSFSSSAEVKPGVFCVSLRASPPSPTYSKNFSVLIGCWVGRSYFVATLVVNSTLKTIR